MLMLVLASAPFTTVFDKERCDECHFVCLAPIFSVLLVRTHEGVRHCRVCRCLLEQRPAVLALLAEGRASQKQTAAKQRVCGIAEGVIPGVTKSLVTTDDS